MNNRRSHQQNHHHTSGNHAQYHPNRGPFSRKEQLERDLYGLEREMMTLDIQIDALHEKGRQLEAAKNTHQASVPFAIAQVALSTLGVRYLPTVARTWHYKHQQYLRAEEQLKQHALSLYTKRNIIALKWSTSRSRSKCCNSNRKFSFQHKTDRLSSIGFVLPVSLFFSTYSSSPSA
jgi:hypothetical protein